MINSRRYIGFAVVLKHIFWDIMLCSSLSVNRRFGGGDMFL
jgi:hypothetical protein